MRPRLLMRTDVFSWCLYDWANSAFVTSVITVVLPVYFLTLTPNGSGPVTVKVGGLALHTNGDALWMYLTGVYMLAAGLTAPVLGAIADEARGRKKFLALCITAGSVLTCGLYFVTAGRYQLCGVVFVGAAFLWTCGNLFYDSLLPDLVSNEREMDAVSSAGYAFGYLGGGVLLAINLAMVSRPAWFGFSGAGEATRAVFVTVGVWWALFSQPALLLVRERHVGPERAPGRSCVVEGFRRLWRTLGRVRRYRQLARMLLAFVFYNTGIGTVITVAVIYGKAELGIGDNTLIACVLMIQLVGFPAAFGFIALARRLGARNSILVGLAVYVGVVVFAFFMETSAEFWVLGVLVALVQGGTQALSRSLYGSMIPEGHAAEFFGFFSIFNKVGSFAGPICFGLVRDVTDSSRLAVLFVASFFIAGALALLCVDVAEGRAQAGATSCK